MIVTADTLKTLGRTVLTGGVFDPLHGGHIAYLRAAKSYDFPVVCAVSPDPGGKHPTLLPLVDRLTVVDALRPVYATVAAHDGIVPILETLKPQAYIKGEDWKGKLPPEEVACCGRLGIPILYTPTKCASSTEFLQSYTQEVSRQGAAAFEQFIHQQQPASKPWEPVTDYSLEARRIVEGKHPQLILDVFKPNAAVDVGCGFGHLIHMMRECGLEHACGLDVNAPDDRDDIYEWSVISDALPPYTEKHDLVICREVLEHLTVKQIRQAVRNLVRLSSKYIYVTTRFNDWPAHPYDVLDHDNLDPTHISLLPKELLRSWFIAEGCKSRPDLEQRMDWKGLGRVLVFEV